MGVQARKRLVDTAVELFYTHGIRAVGVDQLLTESGVGRASFYRHFTSKDDLVVATIEDSGTRWREWLADEIATRGGDPLGAFDALAGRFADPGFRGCAAINAIVEAADPGSSAHRAAAAHKQAVVAYFDGVLSARGYHDHARLAEQFMLLIDGATVTALRRRDPVVAADARAAAAALLNSAMRHHPSADAAAEH